MVDPSSLSDEKTRALANYRKNLLDYREVEQRLKEPRKKEQEMQKDHDKSENDIKSLQSVGQIVGERTLNSFDFVAFMTKSKKKSAKKQAGTRDVKKEKNKAVKRVNPFDLKFNRVKHNVLGKLKDVPVGVPMASRKKAFADMERRLGTEYRNEGKTNTLVDKRIGEKNTALSAEERASKRFTEQRQTIMKAAGGNKYNLPDGDEDLLTHGGRALTAIEKYDRVQESDDDDDEGRLGADLVAAAHFGGGMEDQENIDALDGKRKRRTKRRRFERMTNTTAL